MEKYLTPYLSELNEFLANYKAIRSYYGLDTNISSEVPYFIYQKHILDNPRGEEKISQILSGKNERVLFVAPPNSGKTFAMMEVAKTLEDTFTFIFTPYKRQSIQNGFKYDAMSLVGDDELDLDVLRQNKIWSITFDKANTLAHKLVDLINEGFFDGRTINLIIDEAHMMMCQFRRQGLDRLQALLKLVATKTNGNIIFMTATYQNTPMLDFNKIVAFDNGKPAHFKNVEEIICKKGVKSKDFLAHCVLSRLHQNNKVILRINNKQIMSDLEDLAKSHGYKVATISSETKEDSDVYKTILEKAKLSSQYDLIIVTCLIDAGITIDEMDTDDENTMPTNIVPMYYMDSLNSNLDDIYQFSQRIRWNVDKFVLLVDKHEPIWNEEPKTLRQITKENGQYIMWLKRNLEDIVRALRNIDTNVSETKIYEFINQILHDKDFYERRNDLNGMFSFAFGRNLDFDNFDAFNRAYQKYMLQYFYYDDARRERLKAMFRVPVYRVYIDEDKLEYTYQDFTSIRFDKFVKDSLSIKTDECNLLGDIDKLGNEKHDKRFEQLKDLSEHIGEREAFQLVQGKDKKEIQKVLSQYQEKDAIGLDKEQASMLKSYIQYDNVSKNDLDAQLKRVVDGPYLELFKDALNLDISIQVIQSIIEERGEKGAKEWLRETRVIRTNKIYLQKKLQAQQENETTNSKKVSYGRSGLQQMALIDLVEAKRNNRKNIALSLTDLETIRLDMERETKEKWKLKKILEFVRLVYTGTDEYETIEVMGKKKKRKKKVYKCFVARNLRDNHTPYR